MKIFNSPRIVLAVAGLAVAALAVPAVAETSYMRVDIPFAFLAGNQVLPAGTYHVNVSNSFNYADFRSTNETRIHRVLLSNQRVERSTWGSGVGVLQFQKYGERLVLRAVFSPAQDEGHVFQKSKAEKELARTTSSGGVETIETYMK